MPDEKNIVTLQGIPDDPEKTSLSQASMIPLYRVPVFPPEKNYDVPAALFPYNPVLTAAGLERVNCDECQPV
jgi:hypothetical protein